MDSQEVGALCEYLIDQAGESKTVFMVVCSLPVLTFLETRNSETVSLITRAVNLDFQWLLPSFGRVVRGDFVTAPWSMGRMTRMSVKIRHRNRNLL